MLLIAENRNMSRVTTQPEPAEGQELAIPADDSGATEDSDASAAATGQPRLTVAAVARRLGVAPATLRTWDRRYGL